MDEQYRMLGSERRADFDREARRFAQARLLKRDRVARGRSRNWSFHRVASMLSRSRRTPLEVATPGSAPASQE